MTEKQRHTGILIAFVFSLLLFMHSAEAGMSMDAVLMSCGYPPTTKTPSLKSNFRVYMRRFVTRTVLFKDKRVIDVRR